MVGFSFLQDYTTTFSHLGSGAWQGRGAWLRGGRRGRGRAVEGRGRAETFSLGADSSLEFSLTSRIGNINNDVLY